MLLSSALVLLAIAATPDPTPEPSWTRQPVAPAWSVDLTPGLQPVEKPTDALPTHAGTMTDHLDRPALTARPSIGGHTLHWSAHVALPEVADRHWPVVVEADESRLITGVWFDGKPIDSFDRTPFSQSFGGEGSTLLPLTRSHAQGVLTIRVVQLTHLYDNGFGEIRLRPANLSEIVRIGRFADHPWQWRERAGTQTPAANGKIPLTNRSDLTLRGTLHVRHESYFGESLGGVDIPLELPPRAAHEASVPAPNGSGLYKTRVYFSSGPRTTFDHWHLVDPDRENRQRDEVIKLGREWSFAWVEGELGNKLPAEGWATVKLPHEPNGGNWKSHWGWYRTRINIPEAWRGKRIHLFLNDVRQHATILVDGRPAASRANWELPDTVDLTDFIQFGQNHELAIGVTDHVVALRDGIAIPAKPTSGLPGRGLAAPIDQAFGLRQAPELLAVPTVRTSHAFIRTQTVGSVTCTVDLEFQNELKQPTQVRPVVTLRHRGRKIAQSTSDALTLEPQKTKQVHLEVPVPAQDIQLWDTESPNLYEMSIELASPSGQVLDTRRERFGFRQFDIHGDHLRLNGERINLLGGSHVVLDQEVWPVRPTPYRIIRHYFQAPTGFCSGRVQANLGDEMGVLVKQEHPQHNAMHSDRYAYELPVFWDRALTGMRQNIRLLANHPASIMWDVGNELLLNGAGDTTRMAKLLGDVRELDPTRVVTLGGPSPAVGDAQVYDFHGWGNWSRRDDYYFQNPEQRPSYYAKGGFFARKPREGDVSQWTIIKDKLPAFGYPADGRGDNLTGKLLALDGRPILFSEGHYYENRQIVELAGVDTYRPTPTDPAWSWGWNQAPHWLNWLAARRISLANVRQAGHAMSMIHVDRGVGRGIYPLAAFSLDRALRFASGQMLRDRWTIHHDLKGTRRLQATWRLFDGAREIAQVTHHGDVARGQFAIVPVEMPLPAVTTDRSLRLAVEVTTEGYAGVFSDSLPITLFAPRQIALPDGMKLELWDPKGQLSPDLERDRVGFTKLQTLDAFSGNPQSVLLVASEALHEATPAQRAGVARTIAQGATAIILDHRDLPTFLDVSLSQRRTAMSMAATIDEFSPLTKGLTRRDFMFWRTREGDQLVFWNDIFLPGTGSIRPHLATSSGSPLLEVASGRGRVLFSQLNFRDAWGLEPVTRAVLANMLSWAAQRSSSPRGPESSRTLVVCDDRAFVALLRDRLGLQAEVMASPTQQTIESASLIVLAGNQSATRQAMNPHLSSLRAALSNGSTLFVQNLDDEGAAWLSNLVSSEIRLEPFAMDIAFLRGGKPLLAGMTHADVMWSGPVMRDMGKSLTTDAKQIGHAVVRGPKVEPMIEPEYLGVVRVGAGRVVINMARVLELPTPAATRYLTALLSNCGASLVQGGTFDPAQDAGKWAFSPVDLRSFVNWPLADEPGRRGFHGGGPDNDMRILPRGKVEWLGVTHELVNPDELNGNGCIAVAATKDVGILPQEVRNIPVNRRADRIYFLHNSAWGVPQFIYRIYYAEDLAVWIPGQPDPFVDVIVKPREHIDDWYFAGMITRGERLLPGARIAWKGQTVMSRRGGQEVGVYQMTWDNPHPEKTVAKIDIISPGKVGDGQAFIYGITLAVRKDAVSQTHHPLPAAVAPGTFLHRIVMPRYDLFVQSNGAFRIFSPDGRPIAESEIYLQGMIREASGQVREFRFLDNLDGKSFKIIREEQPNGTVVLTLKDQPMRYFTWTQQLICHPSKIKVDQTFGSFKESPMGRDISLMSHLRFAKEMAVSENIGSPNQPVVPLNTNLGVLTIEMDPAKPPSWYRNYVLTPTRLTGQPLGDEGFKTGAEVKWRYALTLP